MSAVPDMAEAAPNRNRAESELSKDALPLHSQTLAVSMLERTMSTGLYRPEGTFRERGHPCCHSNRHLQVSATYETHEDSSGKGNRRRNWCTVRDCAVALLSKHNIDSKHLPQLTYGGP